MAVKVFVLGRPGSGKSTAFRYIKKYVEERYPDWSAVRFQDYEILQDMFRFDRLFEPDPNRRKFEATDHGGFNVRDFSVVDIALEELEKQVRHRYSPTSDEIIVIEFARDDYGKALEKFSPSFLQDAYFLFIDAAMETCIQRVRERVANRTTGDDHFVSEKILKSYYDKQLMPFSLKRGDILDKGRVKIITSGGLEKAFAEKVYRFVDTIFTSEPVVGHAFVSKGRRWGFAKVRNLVPHASIGKVGGQNSAKVRNPVATLFAKKVHI